MQYIGDIKDMHVLIIINIDTLNFSHVISCNWKTLMEVIFENSWQVTKINVGYFQTLPNLEFGMSLDIFQKSSYAASVHNDVLITCCTCYCIHACDV